MKTTREPSTGDFKISVLKAEIKQLKKDLAAAHAEIESWKQKFDEKDVTEAIDYLREVGK